AGAAGAPGAVDRHRPLSRVPHRHRGVRIRPQERQGLHPAGRGVKRGLATARHFLGPALRAYSASVALVTALVLMFPSLARAHGGLPVSQHILRQNNGETMFVPVVYWGVWVGQAGGPWKWICEELINGYRFRKFALSSDGA